MHIVEVYFVHKIFNTLNSHETWQTDKNIFIFDDTTNGVKTPRLANLVVQSAYLKLGKLIFAKFKNSLKIFMLAFGTEKILMLLCTLYACEYTPYILV